MMKIYDPPRKMPFQRLHKGIYKRCDKNHNPRKGTETFFALCYIHALQIIDKNHNPRKGTETETTVPFKGFRGGNR